MHKRGLNKNIIKDVPKKSFVINLAARQYADNPPRKNRLDWFLKTNYYGSNLAFYGLILFTGLLIWRSLVHFLFWEFGLHDIASVNRLDGTPDPMPLVYIFFSLWGLEQVIRTSLTILVLFKYKGFIPLMLLVNLFEWSMRGIYPLTNFFPCISDEYKNGITPGVEGIPFIILFLIIIFILSLRVKKN